MAKKRALKRAIEYPNKLALFKEMSPDWTIPPPTIAIISPTYVILLIFFFWNIEIITVKIGATHPRSVAFAMDVFRMPRKKQAK